MQQLGLSDSTPRTESRFRNLFWPTIRNDGDLDYLTEQGFWICTVVSAVTLTFGTIRLVTEKTDEGPREGSQPAVYITHRLSLSPSAAVELINGLNTVLSALTQAQARTQAMQQTPGQSH